MTALEWSLVGERFFECGLDRVVFYPQDGFGVVWNGVSSIEENLSGGEIEFLNSDESDYLNTIAGRDIQLSLTAFSAPKEFLMCDGITELQRGLFVTQQPRKLFGLSYRTLINNEFGNVGYKLHLVYNLMSSPTSKNNKSNSNQTDLLTLKWTLDSIPPISLTKRPTAFIVIDSTKYSSNQILDIEDLLYGTTTTEPALPTQEELSVILGGV